MSRASWLIFSMIGIAAVFVAVVTSTIIVITLSEAGMLL